MIKNNLILKRCLTGAGRMYCENFPIKTIALNKQEKWYSNFIMYPE